MRANGSEQAFFGEVVINPSFGNQFRRKPRPFSLRMDRTVPKIKATVGA
jgi:hypothetical protein